MALVHTQNYKDYSKEQRIYTLAERFIQERIRLESYRTDLLATAAEIQADSNADADLKTLATQAQTFGNHVKVTDFISFVSANIG